MKIVIKHHHSNLKNQNGKIGYVALFLGLYFFLMPFDILRIGNIGSLLRITALFPIAAVALNFKNIRIKLDKLVCSLLLVLLLYTLSLYITVSFETTLPVYKTQLMNFIFIFATGVCHQYNEKEIDFLEHTLVLGSILTACLTLIYSDWSMDGRLSLQFDGKTEDPNYLNGYLLFAIAFFFAHLAKEKKFRYFVCCTLLVLFSLFTGSRGALLAIAATGGYAFLNQLNQGKAAKIKVFLGISFAIICIVLFYDALLSLLPPVIAQRFDIKFIQEHGSTGRTDIWKALLEIYSNAPITRQLFGFGLSTTTVINTIRIHGVGYMAHNLWIEQLISIGLVGLVIFLYMQYIFFKAAVKQKDVLLISTYFGFLVMDASLSLTAYKPAWNCMIMILILSSHHRK